MRTIPVEILERNHNLQIHPMYQDLINLDSLKIFMEYHVFAVWDFMSLLKSLQRHITCVTVPWTPSIYPAEVVRMINQIVLGEESDTDQDGKASSHFDLYLRAMKEVGANSDRLLTFLKDYHTSKLPVGIKEFVEFNLDIAINGSVHQVAGAFLFGREKVIPEMFQGILDDIQKSKIDCPTLIYYLERHIELDGGEHSHLALACLEAVCGNDNDNWQEAIEVGLQSLILREKLWDSVKNNILSFH